MQQGSALAWSYIAIDHTFLRLQANPCGIAAWWRGLVTQMQKSISGCVQHYSHCNNYANVIEQVFTLFSVLAAFVGGLFCMMQGSQKVPEITILATPQSSSPANPQAG
ncbi:hypothetical protein [Serratia quinivorans]|uniref:hypothetical protein n=1 Tax=Serratia quinivorans TaxID=137545 RepID=UPI0021BD050B|nr:hypothetical protein [Serratia quinivorans]